MPWIPERCWEGQDAFIIGGGASLRDFDFSLLENRNTIGCNDAFRLGENVCKICLFGDASWFHKNRIELGEFKNSIFHVAPSLIRLDMPGYNGLHRKPKGLWDGNEIGWNFSTGASAVNLAINLGAKRIFLLGIDLQLVNGKSHWHDHRARTTLDPIFQRFVKGFNFIAESLKLEKYQGIEIIHVNNGPVVMPYFMQMPFGEFHVVLEKTQLAEEVPA